MQSYWLTFTDGTQACCEGQSDYDVKIIAEHITKKKLQTTEVLPYPASPLVWQFAHPVVGRCPPFCWQPNTCKGKTACPSQRSCTD